MSECVCACACVCERERERGGNAIKKYISPSGSQILTMRGTTGAPYLIKVENPCPSARLYIVYLFLSI